MFVCDLFQIVTALALTPILSLYVCGLNMSDGRFSEWSHQETRRITLIVHHVKKVSCEIVNSII